MDAEPSRFVEVVAWLPW